MRIIILFFFVVLNIQFLSASSDLGDILNDKSQDFTKTENYHSVGVFRFVDRFNDSNKIIKLKVSPNNLYYVGDFKIKLLKCWKAPKNKEKENAAAIEMFEKKYKDYAEMFSGWLFSNNSFLTNIEHARYDLRLLDCTN